MSGRCLHFVKLSGLERYAILAFRGGRRRTIRSTITRSLDAICVSWRARNDQLGLPKPVGTSLSLVTNDGSLEGMEVQLWTLQSAWERSR
jgi:hypothetical protein